MARLGWTMEQRAGVKAYSRLSTFFAVLCLAIGIATLAMGNAAGWVLIGLAVVLWTGLLLFLRYTKKSQP
ncbi:hypothetical protein ACIQPQ_02930 [Streptomyces sp. NPDC091281]|uniref:hypothetical protein n=1 Tax=Streptomyces sp. NPDC091281 TaxID=3365985 RepID=UPI00380011D8